MIAKKRTLSILVIAAVLLFAVTLTACSGVNLKLTFEVDGKTYASVTTTGQEAIKMPNNPTKKGYTFDGWFWDKGVWERPFTINSLLDIPLSSDMTVYAKWKTSVPVDPETPEHTHDYVLKYDNTNHWYECEVDGEKKDEAAHSFNAWSVVKEATCLSEGEKQRACNVCGYEDVEAIPALEHNYELKYDQTNHWKECSVCKEKKDESKHLFYNNRCKVCEFEYYTQGLTYGQTEYGIFAVTGIGTATNTEIVIPREYKGNRVEGIADRAFENCINLTRVTIPSSVTIIGYFAFENTGIWNNTADNSIVYADKWAIGYKGTITEVELESDTVGIGNGAFYDCRSLTSIMIPENVATLGEGTFNQCYNLKSVAIPQNITSIGTALFFNCTNLTNVTIPNSVTSIGDVAFCQCSSLTSIAIPENVVNIGRGAFELCSGLRDVIIPESVTNIDLEAFIGTAIWDEAPRDSVVYADKWAVGYKGTMTEVELRSDTTGIGSVAFFECRDLKSISIPASVKNIGYGIFASCINLTNIEVATGNTNYRSAGNCIIETESKTLIAGCQTSDIPGDGSVTGIGLAAFYECSGLISITIPSSVTCFSNQAFGGCNDLVVFRYDGTKAQWKAIYKDLWWNDSTRDYTVYCTDGTLTKAESEVV